MKFTITRLYLNFSMVKWLYFKTYERKLLYMIIFALVVSVVYHARESVI